MCLNTMACCCSSCISFSGAAHGCSGHWAGGCRCPIVPLLREHWCGASIAHWRLSTCMLQLKPTDTAIGLLQLSQKAAFQARAAERCGAGPSWLLSSRTWPGVMQLSRGRTACGAAEEMGRSWAHDEQRPLRVRLGWRRRAGVGPSLGSCRAGRSRLGWGGAEVNRPRLGKALAARQGLACDSLLASRLGAGADQKGRTCAGCCWTELRVSWRGALPSVGPGESGRPGNGPRRPRA
jgi:hypothetical protein